MKRTDVWDAFDEVYCLTLEGDIERQRNASRELDALGLGRFVFVAGVKADSPEVAAAYALGKVKPFPPCFRCGKKSCGDDNCNNTLIAPQVGCFLGFMKIFRLAARSQSHTFLVAEDDIKFHDYAAELAIDALSRDELSRLGLFSDAPCVIGLGRVLEGQPKYDGTFEFSAVPAPMNYLFAFNHAFAELAVEQFDAVETTADMYIHYELAARAAAYGLQPPLCHDLSWSVGSFPSRIHPKALAFENEDNSPEMRLAAKAAFDAHIKHTKVIPLAILGTPRGGTRFMSEAMRAVGYDVGHEAMGADGISSWLFTVADVDLPFGVDTYARNSRFVHAETTIAVIRTAPEAIFSLQLENTKNIQSYEFRRRWIKKVEGIDVDSFDTAFERALATYIYWIKLIERRSPDAWVRLEYAQQDIDAIFDRGLLHRREPKAPWPGVTNDRKPYHGIVYSRPVGDWDHLFTSADSRLRRDYRNLEERFKTASAPSRKSSVKAMSSGSTEADPREAPIVFITGLHHSGASPLHKALAAHPECSGFKGTNVPQDEGQHLQTIIPTGQQFGGPGRFALDKRCHLDETSPLASRESARALWQSWSPFWDLGRKVLLEKSPPTIVRTRFFGSLFPRAKFIVIVRHPLVVAKATQKWSKTSLTELAVHWCVAHEQLSLDLARLDNEWLIVPYEKLVLDPDSWTRRLIEFLDLAPGVALPEFERNHDKRYTLTRDDFDQIPTGALSTYFQRVLDRFGYDLSLE